MIAATEAILTTGLAAVGLAGSLGYIALASRRKIPPDAAGSAGEDRPWRVWGAVVCGLISVLFYVGLNHVNPHARPRTFLLLWAVVVLLVLTLCVLAGVDIVHTRRRLRERGRRSDPRA